MDKLYVFTQKRTETKLLRDQRSLFWRIYGALLNPVMPPRSGHFLSSVLLKFTSMLEQMASQIRSGPFQDQRNIVSPAPSEQRSFFWPRSRRNNQSSLSRASDQSER